MWVTIGFLLGLAASAAGAAPATPDTSGFVLNEQALRAYAQGRLLEARGEYHEALGEYVRALAVESQAAPVARRVAELVARMGDASSAIEFADKALAIDSTDARSLWIKGTALLSTGRAAESLPLLEACVGYDSSQVEYFQTLAHAAEVLDRVDLVAQAYAHAVGLDDEDGESWFQLAAAQARLGRFSEADSSLKQAAERSPLRPGQLFLQGWIAESLGRDDEAIDRYRHHLMVHADDQTTRRRLVNLLARRQRWAEAWTESRRVSRAAPEDWETLEVEAELALRSGHANEARPLLARLATLAEPDVDHVGRLCALLIRNDRTPEAIRLADGWGTRHAGDSDAPMLSARVRGVAGQREAALPFARRAVAAAPDSLGWVFYRLGRLQEARTQLERAVDLTDGDPVVREHLGDVYRDLKLRDRAREQYRLSLARDESNARVRAKLASLRP